MNAPWDEQAAPLCTLCEEAPAVTIYDNDAMCASCFAQAAIPPACWYACLDPIANGVSTCCKRSGFS